MATQTVRLLFDERKHGDIAYCRLFGVHIYIVYSPDLAKQVLVDNQKSYKKDKFIQKAGAVLGNGLLRAEGDSWLKQRRLMQPGFHRQRVRGYGETMLAIGQAYTAKLTPGATVDFHAAMTDVTLEIVVQTMFGQSADTDAKTIGPMLEDLLNRFEAMGFIIEPPWWPSPSQLRYHRAARNLNGVITRYIETRRKSPGNDVLSMLLEMKDEQGNGMSEQQIRDEVMTLFLAGHETTALNLVFTWRLLALNPDVAKALRDAVPAALDLEGIMKCELLDQVIKESLRLYPPVYGIPREVVVADTLAGYEVQPGSQVLLAVAAMHRDPRHFPEPDRFLPSRWTKEFEQNLHRYAYFPFGGGPRMCIGAAFADIEAKTVLAALIRRFEPRVTSSEEVDVVSSLTQRPRHGLMATMQPWA